MLKFMSDSDPQRPRLIEAKEAAAKIGQFEADDTVLRAATMACLERSIEGFPVSISHLYHSRSPGLRLV